MAEPLSLSETFKNIFKSAVENGMRKCQRFSAIHRHMFHPLIISNCNGTGSWAFSDATVEYKNCYNTAFPTCFCYSAVFMEIVATKSGFEGQKKEALECLLDYAKHNNKDKHVRCLKSLLKEKASEAKIKTVLAIHYFQPLIPCSHYLIDRGSLTTCELCNKEVSFGDTSFGHREVWNGKADIVIHKSVVKVSSKDYNDSDQEDYDATIDLAYELSPRKQRKTSSSESEEYNWTSILQKSKHKKLKSQALAQGIVNAFCEARQDKSLHDKYMPSFLATEEYIRIILYNCSSDILLLSEELPIWETAEDGDVKLDTTTLLQVWLFLNFETFDKLAPDFVFEDMPSSKFKDVVHNVYSVYLEKVTRLLEPLEHKPKKECLFVSPELIAEKNRKSQEFVSEFFSKMQTL